MGSGRLFRLWKPSVFQGVLKRNRRYFEGWYFKLVSEDRKTVLAIIPGVALGEPADDGSISSTAFVQVIDGRTTRSVFVRYPLEEFSFSRGRFGIKVGKNQFSLSSVELDIDSPELRLKGHFEIHQPAEFPTSIVAPGVMGPFAFVPFMECYHGVVSMNHSLSGRGEIEWRGTGGPNAPIHLDRGLGYIEKDWGRSFPTSWIWAQSNHFDRKNVCIMVSVARIPWLRSYFTGFMAILWIEGRFHTFATYTGARLSSIALSKEQVEIEIVDRKRRLIVQASRAAHGILLAPVEGRMDRRITESIDAAIEVSLYDRSGSLLFEGTGEVAGLEVAGDIAELLAGAGLSSAPELETRVL
ncbi:MAG TPA: tocopherol cyclase family protein [Spirochaetia bacterium]|nr:tocopherol cyclase family protein [Spirochaetia bacterium]